MPLTGIYSELGNSLLYSLQLALDEINDKDVVIIPRDSGFNNKEKLNKAIEDIRFKHATMKSLNKSSKLKSGHFIHADFTKLDDLLLVHGRYSELSGQ